MNNISLLEQLYQEIDDQNISLIKHNLPSRLKGIYYAAKDIPPLIALNNNIQNSQEETCILAEELGHYYTSAGDLVSVKKDSISIMQQENKARRWAARRIITPEKLIEAYEKNIQSLHDLADYLNITEEFLIWSLNYFKVFYGHSFKYDEIYTIFLDPIMVYKNIY